MRNTKSKCPDTEPLHSSLTMALQCIAKCMMVLLLITGWAIPAKAELTIDPAEQAKRKEATLNCIEYVLSHTNSYEFSQKGWLTLGDLSKFRTRIYQDDLQIFVDPAHLGTACAAYDVGNMLIDYDNDLILLHEPELFDYSIEAHGKTAFLLWHEMVHAISHGHQENRMSPSAPLPGWSSKLSFEEEELLDHYYIEWAENFFLYGISALGIFENGLVKLDKDKVPSSQVLRGMQFRWKKVVTIINTRYDPKGFNGVNDIPNSAERLAFEQMTGYSVDDVRLLKGYLAAGYRSEPFSLVATFKDQPLKVTTPLDIEFDASESTGAPYWDGMQVVHYPIERYYWVFDADGANPTMIETTEPKTSHHYDAFGNYRVVLFIVDEDGNISSEFEKHVTVEGLNAQLIATPPQGTAQLSVNLKCKVLSASNPQALLFLWDFDGDGVFDETTNGESDFRGMDNASAIYDKAGTYVAAVEVIDSLGHSDIAHATIVVDAGLTAVLNATPSSGAPPLDVSFDTIGSNSSAGLLTGFEWDFDGNGVFNETHNGESVARHQSTTSHTYDMPGIYTAAVRITDDQNNTGMAKISVTVESDLVAAFTITPQNGPSPLLAIFDATTSTTPLGEIITYLWDFDAAGAGQPHTSMGNYLTLKYPNDGVFKVTLKLRDSQGNESPVASQTLIVGLVGDPPVAAIKISDVSQGGKFDATSAEGMIPLRVKFSAADSTDTDGQVVKYTWHFDDWTQPVTTTTPEVWHEYRLTSRFSPTVIVTDDMGNDSANMPRVTVTAGIAEPELSVVQSPDSSGGTLATCTLLGTYIDDQTVLSGCKWDFGDGSVAVDTVAGNATHVYSAPGTYTIAIEVSYSTNAGGTATVQTKHTVQIGGVLLAKLIVLGSAGGAAPNPVPVGQPVLISAGGSTSPFGAITKYEFDLDGNGSFEVDNGVKLSLAHSFFQPGSITIAMRITDDQGNTETAKHTVTVGALLTAVLTASPPNGSPPLAVQLSASGSTGALAITKYEWDLDGDGSYETDTGAVSATSYTFTKPGSHTVGVQVTDTGGNSATQSASVTVEETNTLSGSLDVAAYDTPNQFGYKGNSDGISPLACRFKGYAKSTTGTPIAKFEIDYTGNGSFVGVRGWGEDASGMLWDSRAEIRDYTYSAPGIYHAALRITDQAGNSVVVTRQVWVDPNVLNLTLSAAPATGQAPLTTTLTAAAQSTTGGSLTYVWDLDDDGNYEQTGWTTQTQTFELPGNYNIGVQVTDDAGNSATSWCTVVVESTALTATLNVTPTTGSPPLKVTCDASGSTNQAGQIHHYIWDINQVGGASTSQEQPESVIEVSFPDPGEYVIRVRACDDQGNESTPAEKRVVVTYPISAVLTASSVNGPAPLAVQLSAAGSSSTTPIIKYEWDLDGDGVYEHDTGAVSENSVSFNNPGTYIVGLRITDSSDQSATTTASIIVDDLQMESGGKCTESQIWSVFPAADEVGMAGVEKQQFHSESPEYGIANYQMSWGTMQTGVFGRYVSVWMGVFDSQELCDKSWNGKMSYAHNVSVISMGDDSMKGMVVAGKNNNDGHHYYIGYAVKGNVLVSFSAASGVSPTTMIDGNAWMTHEEPDFSVLQAMLECLGDLGCNPVP